MTTYLTNRDGGKTNEEGHIRFQTKVWSGNIVSGLQAVQRSPLAMGINISVGDAKVDYSTYGYTVWTDAVVAVTIVTADPSNPRIDRIVGYVDLAVTPSTSNTNNPGILKFMAIAGTPAGSPSRPSNGTVQTAVGASNPYFDVADILVGTGVTTISTANITDTRVFVSAALAANSVTNTALADASVTNAKLSTTAGDIGGDMLTWSPNLVGFSANPNGQYFYTKAGRKVTLYIIQTTNGTSNSATFTISLPLTAATQASFYWQTVCQVVDNGSSVSGIATILSGGTVLNLFKNVGGDGFTTSGNKRTTGMQITYMAAA